MSCAGILWAQEEDDIIISNGTHIYEYKNVNGRVVVDEKKNTVYACVKRPDRIYVVEYYNDFSTINKAVVKGIKGVRPQYGMYHSDIFFHHDIKMCSFTIPFTHKGQKAEVITEKRYEDPVHFTTIYLAELQKIAEQDIRIVVPPWMEVTILERNCGENIVRNEETDAKGNKVYNYSIRELPAMKQEPSMPGYMHIYPYLVVVPRKAVVNRQKISFFDSYDHMYQWCRSMLEKSVNDETILTEKANQLTAHCTTKEEQIRELYAWVQQNIRYIAFEQGLAGYIPDSAHEVLRKKYGDCKGMSNLLAGMLRTLGFDARVAWIGTKEIAGNDSVHVPMFNHMICALKQDNEWLYLDPTAKYMAVDEYPEGIQGQTVLIEAGDQWIRNRVPVKPFTQNKDSLHCVYRLEEGVLTGEASLTFTGEHKQALLATLHTLVSPTRENVFKQFLERNNVQDEVSDIQFHDNNPYANECRISYHSRRRSGMQQVGDALYIDMGINKSSYYSEIDTVKRVHDYIFPFRGETLRKETLIIPEGYVIETIPQDLYIERKGYTLSITYLTEEDRITYQKEIRLTDTWLAKQDFPLWNEDLNRLRKQDNEYIILQKTIKTEP
ncbi:transglutaminase-like domain-containing protein [Parabacteroides sp. OttesenSCG-928-K15]|nr:transglutaminase-like domain-containing protein [Parabacteroides sp. OttesenSCG-928-K15]